MGIKISVITPTYNRGHLLTRCYDSLCEQEFNAFEWIIIDDGSSDDTKNVVKSFLKDGKVHIRYIYQANRGKHIAHNVGVTEARGELCVCLDSDDYFSKNALSRVWTLWAFASKNNIGIIAKRGDAEGNAICSDFPSGVRACSMYDLNNMYHFHGDTVLFFKTGLLKRNMFPAFEGEKFIPETALYYVLDKYGTMLIADEVLYIGEYQNDGLTSKYHKLLIGNPIGTTYAYFVSLQVARQWKEKIKYFILTAAYWQPKCKEYFRVPIYVQIFRPLGWLYRKVRLKNL